MASVELVGNPTWPKTLRPICVLSSRCWRTVSRSLSSVRRVTAMPCMAGISIIYCHVHVMKRCAPRQVTSVMDFGATFIIQAFSKELIKDKHSSGKPRSEGVPEYRYFGILRKTGPIASGVGEATANKIMDQQAHGNGYSRHNFEAMPE